MDEQKSQPDPWEEEIDLRELILNVAKKWYIWLGLPLLVVLATGLYYWTTPDRYEVREGLRLEVSARRAQNLDLPLPKTSVYQQILSEKDFPGEVNVKRGVHLDSLEFTVSVITSTPEETAKELRRVLPGSFVNLLQGYSEKLVVRREGLNRSLEWLRENLSTWREELEEAGYTNVAAPDDFAEEFRNIKRSLRIIDELKAPAEITEDAQAPAKISEIAPDDLFAREPVGPVRPRNTLLAGVVTFLLTLFGTTFWEIL